MCVKVEWVSGLVLLPLEQGVACGGWRGALWSWFFWGRYGYLVQAGDGIVWSGGAPFIVMARLSFRSFFVMYSACFLWYSSSASGSVASDVLLEDLCGNFVSTWCLLFRLRSATSRLLVFVILIQASRLFQKMTRASLDNIPENAVFFKIPVQINGSRSN